MASWLAQIAQAEGGQLRFDRFVELALYHPIHGYYSRHIPAIGPKGDFSTSATLSNSLGRAIGGWIENEARELKLRPLTIVELGAGSGELAASVLRRLRKYSKPNYRIVETSPILIREQQRRLDRHNARWFPSVEEAVNGLAGAVIFSNEFVDAFPCRRFVKNRGFWFEFFLRFDSSSWHEEVRPVEHWPNSTSLECTNIFRQVVEVHEAYRTWLRKLCSRLRRGALLTVDYGGTVGEIFDRAPEGTIRAYYQHQRLTGREIYLRAGHQDLTADVNFSDLQNWGAELGLETVTYSTQADFLAGWSEKAPMSSADKFVSDPAGAGSAFKVLHQRKVLRIGD
jgi:SAM-dependent MidA family methyltransferase